MPVAGSASHAPALSPRSLPGLTAWWDAGAITRKSPDQVAGLQAWWKAEDAGQRLSVDERTFENDQGNWNPQVGTARRSMAFANSGKFSFQYTAGTNSGSCAILNNNGGATGWSITSTEVLTLSGWVYTESTNITSVNASFVYNRGGAAGDIVVGTAVPITRGKWSYVSFSQTNPNVLNDGVTAYFYLNGAATIIPGETIYFDDISFVTDHVASWTDSSGHGYNLSQATVGKRPVLAQNVSNGKPGVLFDGTDDYLQTATFGSAIAQPASVFLVVKRTNALTIDTYIDGIANTFMVAENTTQLQGNFGVLAANGTPSSVTPTIISCTTDAGLTDKMYLNGVLNWGPADGGSNSLDGLTLGIKKDLTTDPLIGHIMEVVIFSGALSDADRQAVELYLANKYGIGSTVASLPNLVAGGNALAQATDANKPLLAANVVAGRPVIRFDGVNDTLTGNIAMTTTSTIFVVAKKQTAVGVGSKAVASFGAGNAQIYTDSGQSATDYNWWQNQLAAVNKFTGATSQAWGVLTLIVNSAASMDSTFNGTTVGANFDPNDLITTAAYTTWGGDGTGANFGDFDIAEVIVYNVVLSASQRKQVERYLGNKYGITVA